MVKWQSYPIANTKKVYILKHSNGRSGTKKAQCLKWKKKKKINLTRRAQLLIWIGRNKNKKFEDISKNNKNE